jgi:hypothetical protein
VLWERNTFLFFQVASDFYPLFCIQFRIWKIKKIVIRSEYVSEELSTA